LPVTILNTNWSRIKKPIGLTLDNPSMAGCRSREALDEDQLNLVARVAAYSLWRAVFSRQAIRFDPRTVIRTAREFVDESSLAITRPSTTWRPDAWLLGYYLSDARLRLKPSSKSFWRPEQSRHRQVMFLKPLGFNFFCTLYRFITTPAPAQANVYTQQLGENAIYGFESPALIL